MKRLFTLFISATLLSSPLPVLAADEVPTISTRIVGGTQSAAGQWPSMVSIKLKGYINGHFCGGSLIAKQWVLTAAHCMFDEQGLPRIAAEITATVGEYDLTSSPVTQATEIKKIVIHPDYDSNSQINDLALLKLSTPVANEPVTWIDRQLTKDLIAWQYPVTALGWGSTISYESGQPATANYPNILNQVEIPLNSDQQCQTALGTNYSSEMICAGLPEGGKDACQGDSGGPLMVNANYGWQQIGIVSWGLGCAAAGSPGVYTRLGLYSAWIDANLKPASITADSEFLYSAVGKTENKQLTVRNNSDSNGTFTYNLTGSNFFSFDASRCTTISANSTCQFSVTYTPQNINLHQAAITVNSDIYNAGTMTAALSGRPLASAENLLASIGLKVNNSAWYSGGDQTWRASSSIHNLQSGQVGDDQRSILMANISGKGRFKFSWAVGSEYNYDLLTLLINGQKIKSISGQQDFQEENAYLDQDVNSVVWIYRKDSDNKTLTDSGFVSAINFQEMSRSEYDRQLLAENNSSKSSGSFGFYICLLLPLVLLRRYHP